MVAHVLDLPQEGILQAAVEPPFDRDVLGDGLEEGTECAPEEEEEDGTSAVDDGRIGVIGECVRDVEDGDEDGDQVVERLHGLVKHCGR